MCFCCFSRLKKRSMALVFVIFNISLHGFKEIMKSGACICMVGKIKRGILC